MAARCWPKYLKLVGAAIVAMGPAGPARAGSLDCAPGEGRASATVSGVVTAGERFAAPVGPGWAFALEPDPNGWILRLRAADDKDLARITPPYHFVPNPRDLHGWHFRNRANTGPNVGDVNAPQHHREFIFDRALNPGLSDGERVAAAEGRGELLILDFELSPPKPGERARFESLNFEACLSWPEAWEK